MAPARSELQKELGKQIAAHLPAVLEAGCRRSCTSAPRQGPPCLISRRVPDASSVLEPSTDHHNMPQPTFSRFFGTIVD